MPRVAGRQLKDAQVRSAQRQEKPYELHDGEGLSLYVDPSGTKTWRLRYLNAKGERPRVTLGKFPDISLADARRESERLRSEVTRGIDPAAQRAAVREQGELERKNTLEAVVRGYIEAEGASWKKSTSSTYKSALGRFLAWAADNHHDLPRDITAARLAEYRAYAAKLPRFTKKKGGGRHDVESTGERRSPEAVNADLRATKTMLQTLRRQKRLPNITSSDDIIDNLKGLREDKTRPEPLKQSKLRELLTACDRYDDHCDKPIGPLVVFMLLSGLRLGEALDLPWANVDLEAEQIRVAPRKTKSERFVDLGVSPTLVRLLAALKRSNQNADVFDYTQATALDARHRLISDFGAPEFLWSTRNSRIEERSPPTLRSTCGCYLTCAPAIYAGASVYQASARLGHGPDVATKHYLSSIRRIPADARTLEAAMGIEHELELILDRLPGRRPGRPLRLLNS